MTYFLHSRVLSAPTQWRAVSDALSKSFTDPTTIKEGSRLYGIWRSQIGRPRDELTVVTTWPEVERSEQKFTVFIEGTPGVVGHSSIVLAP